MKDLNHIQTQVDLAYNSLEGIKTSGPGPFFFTRVQARLNAEQKNVWESLSAFISRPSIAIASICLIIMINAAAVFTEKSPTPSLADQPDQIYTEEYNMAVNSFYEIENSEP
jgi:hypothetical protein